jgi:hypothetical protein
LVFNFWTVQDIKEIPTLSDNMVSAYNMMVSNNMLSDNMWSDNIIIRADNIMLSDNMLSDTIMLADNMLSDIIVLSDKGYHIFFFLENFTHSGSLKELWYQSEKLFFMVTKGKKISQF